MGISAGGKGGPKSDINVTPLVDVVLVLLIIFLVTMPVLMRHITIEVPRKLDSEVEFSAGTHLTVIGKADGSVMLQEGADERTVNRVDLPKTLRDHLESKKENEVVFVDFEDNLPYAEAVSIMDTVKGAGKGLGREGHDVDVALKIREEDQRKPPTE